MNMILLLCLLVGVNTYIIRDVIDRTDTINCTINKPVFGLKFNDTKRKRCIPKTEMIGKFMDINIITWLKIDFYIHETYTLQNNWIKSRIQFRQYKHLIEYKPPGYGVLILLKGRRQRLISRSFGKEIWTKPTKKTIKVLTKKIVTKQTPVKPKEITTRTRSKNKTINVIK